MSSGRLHNRTRLLVTIWTLIWMVLAAPCAVAGDMAMAGAETIGAEASHHFSGHPSPSGDGDPAAQLLCLQDCNQLALGQGNQYQPPAPLVALAEDRIGHPIPSLSGSPSTVIRRGGPLGFRAATYLLNQSFLI